MSLDAVFAQIEEAHAHRLEQVEDAYVELLRRLHENPDALDEEPARLAEVVREANRTPKQLQADLERYRKIQQLAARANSQEQVQAKHRAALEALRAARAHWEQTLRQARDELTKAEGAELGLLHELERVGDAEIELRAALNVRGELHDVGQAYQRACRELEGRPDDAALRANACALGARKTELEQGSLALRFLRRAFFPPPEVPESNVVRYEGCEWRVGPRPASQ